MSIVKAQEIQNIESTVYCTSYRTNAFLASSLAFRALARAGRVPLLDVVAGLGTPLAGPDIDPEIEVPRRPTAFAAATARSRLPLLGRLLMLLAVLAALPARSILLRNGLGRFSSSRRSYSGESCLAGFRNVGRGAVTAVCRCGWGRGFGWGCTAVTDEEAQRPVGSEWEAGRVAACFNVGRRDEVRMDGRRMRVGGGAEVDGADEADEESEFSRSLSFDLSSSLSFSSLCFSFRELGLGGGLAPSSSLSG